MKRQRLKTPIMLKNGSTDWQFNAILLVGITFLPKVILSLENNNFQHQRYDYIDVAKEAPKNRSRGQTTRIFTTDDGLDEKFWLKYLGEDIRHAVHIHVDDDNNVRPVEEDKSQRQSTFKYDTREEKQCTRFVRQPAQDENEQEPVDNLYQRDNIQYTTEKRETLKENVITTPETVTLSRTKHEHFNNQVKLSNKKLWKHKDKLPVYNKQKQKIIHVKPPKIFKPMHEPIVVNLPEVDSAEYQINEEHAPVVVQIPPIIYHQRAELYSENSDE